MWPWPQRRARAPAGRAVTGCAGLCPRPPPPHPPVPVTQQVDDASRGLELAWIGNQGLTLEDTSSSTQSHLKTPPAPSSPRGTRYCIGVPAQRPARACARAPACARRHSASPEGGGPVPGDRHAGRAGSEPTLATSQPLPCARSRVMLLKFPAVFPRRASNAIRGSAREQTWGTLCVNRTSPRWPLGHPCCGQ